MGPRFLAVAVFVVFVSGPLFPTLLSAAESPAEQDLKAHAASLDRDAATPQGEARVTQHLASELKLPPATLEAQRKATGLGWGEILIANRLAQTTGKSFDEIVNEFKSGKGWGGIAREHNVNLGKLVSETKQAHEAVAAKARHEEEGHRPPQKVEEAPHGREGGMGGHGGMGGRGGGMNHGGHGRGR